MMNQAPPTVLLCLMAVVLCLLRKLYIPQLSLSLSLSLSQIKHEKTNLINIASLTNKGHLRSHMGVLFHQVSSQCEDPGKGGGGAGL
jgi:hypothetical protein